MPITFLHPLYFTLILLVLPMLIVWYKRQKAVAHSNIGLHANLRSWSLLPKLPSLVFIIAWTLICLSLAQPALTNITERQVIETRDIIVSVDISGSMTDRISTSASGAAPGWCLQYGCPVAQGTSKKPITADTQPAKLDLARQSVKYFISQRKGDRIGLMAFDSETYYMWPLSSDEELVARRANMLDEPGGGTDFAGEKGPIQAALDHFRQNSHARTKILLLVTDGGAPMSPDRTALLSKQMSEMNVKLYVLGVGDDWTSGDRMTNYLRSFTADNNGTVVNVGSAEELQTAIEQINQTERSAVTLEHQVAYHNLYPYFVAASLLLWFIFLLLNAITRRVA